VIAGRRQAGSSKERIISRSFILNDDDAAAAEWYLTVRCTNPTCGRLIAFQKAKYPGGSPDLRVRIDGEPSVDCPHCKTLVRVRADQIQHRQVVLTQ
jgi:hypothetical protein